MRPENNSGIVDIISKKDGCTIDSSITLRMEPALGLLRAEISQNISLRFENRLELNPEQCWHHIAWVRSGLNLQLYYDGVLAETTALSPNLDASNNGVFSIANSPCLANGELRFRGAMDELRLYNRSLGSGEIQELARIVDKITTRDTIIFLGSNLQPRLPNSCATNFSWTPVSNVFQPGDQNPCSRRQ